MKKLISFSLVALLCSSTFTQGQTDKKSSDNNKIKEVAKANILDGRSFKIAFSERQAEVKPVTQTDVPIPNDAKTIEKPVSDYSDFDANSKVMLTFSDGKILSPVLTGEGCAYQTNAAGNGMYAFSSYCRMNTGNRKAEADISAQDTKMKIDAANSKQVATEPGTADVTQPVSIPPDETKQHLPSGVARDDNADLNTPPAGTVPPTMQKEEIQRQIESPVSNHPGSMATISGVINGNAIQGVLSWTETDGRKMSYAFSGSAATKKDMNDSQVVGMK